MRKAAFTADLGMLGARSVIGWQLACGAVVHRAALRGGSQSDWLWTVSDPVSGCAYVQGLGLAAVVRAYRQLVRDHGDGWAAALADRRQRAQRIQALMRRLDADRADLHAAPEMVQ